MRNAETVLGIIHERGKRGLPLEDVYRQTPLDTGNGIQEAKNHGGLQKVPPGDSFRKANRIYCCVKGDTGEPDTPKGVCPVRGGADRKVLQRQLAGRLLHFVVLFKSKRQAEKAFAVMKSCIEEDLGLTLSEEKTKITTFGKGFVFLGFLTSARTIRMSPKAEGRFKDKIRDLTVRKHNLDREVVEKVNRRWYGEQSTTSTPRSVRVLDSSTGWTVG
jgi:hypothetical protein